MREREREHADRQKEWLTANRLTDGGERDRDRW